MQAILLNHPGYQASPPPHLVLMHQWTGQSGQKNNIFWTFLKNYSIIFSGCFPSPKLKDIFCENFEKNSFFFPKIFADFSFFIDFFYFLGNKFGILKILQKLMDIFSGCSASPYKRLKDIFCEKLEYKVFQKISYNFF